MEIEHAPIFLCFSLELDEFSFSFPTCLSFQIRQKLPPLTSGGLSGTETPRLDHNDVTGAVFKLGTGMWRTAAISISLFHCFCAGSSKELAPCSTGQ
jgi:hypothetical protein